MTKVYHTSKSDGWGTPAPLFELLHEEFKFSLDAAATKQSALCWKFITPGQDALSFDWADRIGHRETVFLNPPYSLNAQFMEAALENSVHLGAVVCLLPVRTGTRWWQEYVPQSDEVRLIGGRLKFEGAEQGAPFDSCVVVFRGSQSYANFAYLRQPRFTHWKLTPKERGF